MSHFVSDKHWICPTFSLLRSGHPNLSCHTDINNSAYWKHLHSLSVTCLTISCQAVMLLEEQATQSTMWNGNFLRAVSEKKMMLCKLKNSGEFIYVDKKKNKLRKKTTENEGIMRANVVINFGSWCGNQKRTKFLIAKNVLFVQCCSCLIRRDKQRSVEEKHSRSGEEEKKAAYQQ